MVNGIISVPAEWFCKNNQNPNTECRPRAEKNEINYFNMKTHKILPIVATVILAGAMFFAGCEKEKKAIDESENHINLSSQSLKLP